MTPSEYRHGHTEQDTHYLSLDWASYNSLLISVFRKKPSLLEAEHSLEVQYLIVPLVSFKLSKFSQSPRHAVVVKTKILLGLQSLSQSLLYSTALVQET